MIARRIEKKVEEALSRSASVALMGPRQVGKTTIALNISDSGTAVYLDLENNLDLQKIQDINAFHAENSQQLIIMDEVQRIPQIFAALRGIIDKERRKGHKYGLFLFLGSASIDLLQQSSESLAGRIAYLELQGIDALEFGTGTIDKLNQLWLRGGFPDSLLASSDRNSLAWRRDFIKTYLERDIPQLGPRIPAVTLERFWTMLAHVQGGVTNASQLAKSLEVSATTISRYLDLMVDLLLVRRLQPWGSNVGKRLVKSPKIYVRDSGLTHALLNIENYNDLLGHPVAGGSWEGFVIENILSTVPDGVIPYYYRTAHGAEIDLVLEFSGREKWAIEIKRSSSPTLSKGFYLACQDIGPDKRFVVYAGQDQFNIGENITAIPLHQIMSKLLEYKGI
ncbi:ATP-binding protein [Mucilaginibacter ginsenosidivorax]|uniref:ATP-binding protein n=1 Tax=Mucilaginibacter ginsenosidivorax TaxID=862126 RepID=A0A5B8W292_9SPHI|nr:ATP-binding protein [Mucilaginibacter ginsenosidivorax]QEC76458.1 ATP-binding protein [Mucilaginibacter ginsenosidivorax]